MKAQRIGMAALAGALAVGMVSAGPLAAQSAAEVTAATVEQWMADLSNWGRWGEDDQAGTLNLITPEKRTAAAGLVSAGLPVSLSHTYLTEADVEATSPVGYEMLGPDRPGPFRSDRYTFAYHGYAHSHMDSLCHMMHDGRMYNGFVRDEQVTADGCAKLAIINFKQGIVSRGVLLDIPRSKGVDWVDPTQPVMPADLEAAEQAQGVRVEEGDILLIRTGNYRMRLDTGPLKPTDPMTACQAACAPWFKERGVAMMGTDTSNDARPSPYTTIGNPLHTLCLVSLGLWLIDNTNLEELSQACAGRGRYEFMLTLAPLRLRNVTGSPVNPIALF